MSIARSVFRFVFGYRAPPKRRRSKAATAAPPAPEPVAATPTPEPVAATPTPEPVAAAPPPEPVAVAPAPEPVAVAPPPEPVAATPAPEPVAAAPPPEPVAAAPPPEPVAETPAPEPVAEAPAPEPVAEVPTPEPVAEAPAPTAEPAPPEPFVEPAPPEHVAEAPPLEPAPAPVVPPVADRPEDEPDIDTDPNFPPLPDFPATTSLGQRQAMFGAFEFVHEPVPGNAENIKILGSWERENIVDVPIPQLKLALGAGAPSSIRFHRKAAAQLQGLWADWEQAGLLDRILSFDGAFVPRFIRGSTRTLSNHAFGSAFDLNWRFNQLGQLPAKVGERGCVRELVPLAHKHGFFWGGHYRSRFDGMHFEIAKLANCVA